MAIHIDGENSYSLWAAQQPRGRLRRARSRLQCGSSAASAGREATSQALLF
jgi:hypothetical protein